MKQEIKASVRINVYTVILNAVQEGVSRGWRKAHKHTETPSDEAIVSGIMDSVMLELSEILKFD